MGTEVLTVQFLCTRGCPLVITQHSVVSEENPCKLCPFDHQRATSCQLYGNKQINT